MGELTGYIVIGKFSALRARMALCLLVGFLFFVPGQMARAAESCLLFGPEVESPVIMPLDVTGEDKRQQAPDFAWSSVPDSSVQMAVLYYFGVDVLRDRERALNTLRFFVWEAAPHIVEFNRAWAVKCDRHGSYVRLFDEAVAWVEKVRAADAEYVYAASKEIQAMDKKSHARRLAWALRWRADKMGHPGARMDYGLEILAKDDPEQQRIGRIALRLLGIEKYGPAFKELIARNLGGRGFAKSPARAYLWMLRARAAGLDMDDRIKALRETLSPGARKKAERWYSRGAYMTDSTK